MWCCPASGFHWFGCVSGGPRCSRSRSIKGSCFGRTPTISTCTAHTSKDVYTYVHPPCICMCIYIYMCVCMLSLSLVYIHIHILYIYTHTYTHVLYYMYLYIYMCVYIVYVCICICMCICMCMCICICISICICIWKLIFHQVHCLPEPISAFVFWWRFSCKCQHGA